MRLLTILIICCLHCVTSIAQNKYNMSLSSREAKDIYAYYEDNKKKDLDYAQKIPPHQLQADLKMLKLMLEEAHTNMYNYSTLTQVNKFFEEAFAQAQDSLPYLGLVKLVARIQNEIACGHSNWNHPASYRKYREENITFLPLEIKVLDDTCYIVENYTSSLVKDRKLERINNVPADSILRLFRKHMTRDGTSDTANELELSESFRFAYSNFIGNPKEFNISYSGVKQPTRPREASFLGLPREEIDSLAEQRGYKPNMGTPLSLSIDDKTAIYKIKWFNNEYIQSQGQEFISFTDSVFRELQNKNVKTLIIDLRGNVGGWTANGRHLFSYFIDKQVPYIKTVKTQKYKDFSFAPLITNMPGYNDTMKLVLKDGLYEWRNNPNLMAYPASKNKFTGKVFIITDGYTRSAASIFCALMKEHTKATFMGEETGASRSVQGGMVMTVQLPYSHLLVNFSTARYDLAVSNHSSSGITPDIIIPRTYYFFESRYMNRVQYIIKQLQ